MTQMSPRGVLKVAVRAGATSAIGVPRITGIRGSSSTGAILPSQLPLRRPFKVPFALPPAPKRAARHGPQ